MAAPEQKLNKIFDQNVQITGNLTVDGDLVGYSGDNFYLDGITKSGNTLTFSVNGATNQSYTFGSNAFTSYTDHSTAGYLLATAKAADSDLLDGINSSGFIRDYGSTTVSDYNGLSEGIIGTTSTTSSNIPYANHNITMTLYNDASSGRKAQLFFGDTPGRLYWRASQGTSNPPDGWHPWEQVVTSNNIGDYALTSYSETSTLDAVADRGRTTNQQLISTNPAGFRVDSGSYARIELDSTDNWSYVRLQDQGTTTWDIACYNSGSLEWRPGGGTANRMSLTTSGSLLVNEVWPQTSTNSARFTGAGDWGTRHYTSSGYIQFGPANTGWAHIYTDRPGFYFNKDLHVNGNQVFHYGNDGPGSGMNADLLDNLHATDFVQQLGDTNNPNYQTPSSRRVDPNASNPTNEHYAISTFGNGGNVTGQLAVHLSNGSGYLRSHNNSWSGWRKIWTDANDGSGSGLDADRLDGLQGSEFLRSNTADTATGMITFAGSTRFPDTNGTAQSMWGIYGWDTQLQFTKRALSGDGYQGTGMFIEYNGLYVQSDYSFRSPIFYDSTNTNRFVDPGATSILGFASFEGANSDYNARTSTGVSIGQYTSDYAYIELGSTHANGSWIDFSKADGTDYAGRIRHFNTDQQMKFYVNGSSSETLNINTGGINVSGSVVATGLVYQAAHQASNLAVGWYTIAVNEGNRAVGRFGIRERAGGRHQTAVFYASHHYGANSGITMLHSGFYSGTPFRYIRVKEGGTYDGALLQVYIEDPSNNLDAFLLGDDFQTGGWILKDWVPDGTNPGDVGSFGNLTNVAAQIDWNDAANGGIIASGNIMAEGDVKSNAHMYCAGKYYDWGNTTYFVEAASQSNLSSLVVGSTVLGDGRMAVRGGDLILDRGSEIRWTNTTGSGEYIWSEAGSPYTLHLHSGAYNAVSCPNTGQVYINYNGAARITTTSAGISVTGTMTASSDVVAYSDERVKENIETIPEALNKVKQLRGVTYNRTDIDDKSKKIGVIAQEIYKVLPEVVLEQEDGMLGVSYGNITAVLIEAIKEQQKQIDGLKSLINKS